MISQRLRVLFLGGVIVPSGCKMFNTRNTNGPYKPAWPVIPFPVGNSSVSVRFVLAKWANESFLFDHIGQWELLI